MADILKLVPGTGTNFKELKRNSDLVSMLLTALLATYGQAGSPMLKGMLANLKTMRRNAISLKADGKYQDAIDKAIEFVESFIALKDPQ